MAGSLLKGKKVLITSGPTCVAIDDMRVITNRATGILGSLLAKEFIQAKAQVTLLQGPVEQTPKIPKVKLKNFYFFKELENSLYTMLKQPLDVVIHNAAVSDYELKSPFKGKISTHQHTLKLELTPTPKLINKIKKINPQVKLVGFKLENFKSQKQILEESDKLFKDAQCDWVVANTLKGGYRAYLISNDRRIQSISDSRQELAHRLIQVLKETL